MRRASALAALALLLTCTSSPAAISTRSGREWGFWTLWHTSVIIARVTDVQTITKNYSYWLVLEPVATLAGEFDPSTRPTMKCALNAALIGASVQDPPPKGSLILAVFVPDVEFRPGAEHPESIKCDIIDTNFHQYMPEDKGFVVLNGMNDPRILATLKRIQEARAHPNPSPYPAPTTRPASDRSTTPASAR